MDQVTQLRDRRTSVDVVFDHLYDEITSLRLLPGTKISEAEIASRFSVSRQPVRDAFSRLANMELLLIRPQKATEVRRFSAEAISKSRFIRAAVEAEVLRRAAAECDAEGSARLEASLDTQRQAVARGRQERFAELDYEFHKTLCEVAKVAFAFDVISKEKAKVDRLCRLSLATENKMTQLMEDHENMAKVVIAGDAEKAVEIGMLHLSRLDGTIASISSRNADYFE